MARRAEALIQTDRATLKQAFYSGKVITPKAHKAALNLLTIFAQHLAMMSNQVFIQSENTEPPVITTARN